MKEISIYCDGSAIGNPGPGGWGAVLMTFESRGGRSVSEIGGSEKHTTNNRMEITAAIETLKKIKSEASVTLKTDSQYLINGITKWVYGWERNGWQTSQRTDVLNKDLWQELMKVTSKLDVTFEHVRGHAGDTMNERVDVIANSFARGEKIKLFSGDEKSYKEFLKDAPKPRVTSKGSSGKAYSYISMVDGDIKTHDTWGECERRVREVKGARFKKALSFEEERAIIEDFKKIKTRK